MTTRISLPRLSAVWWRLRRALWTGTFLTGALASTGCDAQGQLSALERPQGGAARVTYRGVSYDLFAMRPGSARLELFWKDERGRELRSLRGLRDHVQRQGRRLVFATNAGMYDDDSSQHGLHVADGRTLSPLDLKQGLPGNFYLRPNGVFFLGRGRAGILESAAFRRAVSPDSLVLATQSGPMLVTGGRIHPAFREGSRNLHIRSGVGILADGRVVFAISNEPVSFYDFAMLFRERLGCRDALFLDGAVSLMYLPELARRNLGGNFGGMLAVTAEP